MFPSVSYLNYTIAFVFSAFSEKQKHERLDTLYIFYTLFRLQQLEFHYQNKERAVSAHQAASAASYCHYF